MKTIKSILSILIILTIAACSNVQASEQTSEYTPIQTQYNKSTQSESTINPFDKYKVFYNPPIKSYINNVNNNQEYTYKVTSITDNGEIHGKALNKISSDNAGIFLYQSELDFNVKPGDTIAVVWGENEDEFKSIKKVN